MSTNNLTPAALAAAAKGDLANAIIASTPGGIEASEKRGQTHFVNSQLMPIELKPSIEAFIDAGFTFGKAVDELFQEAIFPEGWVKEASDHAMHSSIKDANGFERVSVFYKAAFYDRRAHARLMPRFTISVDFGDYSAPYDANRMTTMLVIDACGIVKQSFGSFKMSDYETERVHIKEAKDWMAEHYPFYENPVAHWDVK